MYRSGLVSVSTSLLFVLILTWIPAGGRSSGADPVDPADIERLKARVSEYFKAVHSRQFTRAKEFILPGSRDASGPPRRGRTRISGFGIIGVKMEGGGRSAVVTIKREVMAVGLAGQTRIKEKFRWKKEEGDWFLDPADPPTTTAEIFRDYYYTKRAARANPKPGQKPPPLLVELDETVFDFGVAAQGDVVHPRFAFRNLGSEAILIEEVYGPEWLLNRTKSRPVPPGTTGEIKMEMNTSGFQRDFVQDVFVRFEPIQELVKLRIKGKVYTAEEIALSPVLSKKAAANKASRAATP